MSRFRIDEDTYPYFLTCSIVKWLPVFVSEQTCNIVLDSLRHCREKKGLLIHAYVVMPTHVHLVLSAPNLTGVLRDFKRYTAAKLVAHHQQVADPPFSNVFRFCGRDNRPPTDHMVWQHDNHPEQIRTESFLSQKIDYCHWNPVRKGLVDDPSHWRYSSARDYLVDQQGLLPVDRVQG